MHNNKDMEDLFPVPACQDLGKENEDNADDDDDDDDLELGTSIAYRASSASYPAAYLTISQ